MDLKRILVAINSLNGRDAAFERALVLAKSSGAELYLLHAVPVNDPFSFRATERLERMADMRTRAEDAGVRVQTVEQHGDAAEIIELHANARVVDLIVMGHEVRPRGWGRHRSSVVERVIARTSVPTLVVASDTPDIPTAFRNALVAIDLSLASNEVLRGAVGLMADETAQLTVMHAVDGVTASGAVQTLAPWMAEYRTHVLEDARRALEAVVSAVPSGVDTRVLVSTGSAARTILEQAADVDADLVVVGRNRRFKIRGSTVLRVLRKNQRALLVIPGVDHRTARVEHQRAA